MSLALRGDLRGLYSGFTIDVVEIRRSRSEEALFEKLRDIYFSIHDARTLIIFLIEVLNECSSLDNRVLRVSAVSDH